MADPDTGSTEFEFGQPVSTERLIPFDVADLEEPIDDQDLNLEIRRGLGDGEWMKARISKQTATGMIKLVYEDGREEIVDLAEEEYRWVR